MLILQYCLRLEESLSSFEYLLRFRGSIENKRALSHFGFGIKLYPKPNDFIVFIK